MNKTTILKIKSWHCPSCGYTAPSRIDPYGAKFLRKYPGVVAGGCPSCATHPVERKHTPLELLEGVDLEAMVRIESASDAEIEASELVPDLDANGQPIMEQTGERKRLGIVNGKPAVITEPIMQPKMVPAPKEQVDALKLQRDKSLDALEKVAVKEVTPTTDEPADEPARTR